MSSPNKAHSFPRAPIPFNRLLPNILTTLALCAGMTAIRFGLQGRFKVAVLALVVAAVLDTLDGRLARLLKGQTHFGAELDSLSDVVSFGIAPAILNYLWVLKDAGALGWIASLIFTVCAALRLARFNARLGASDLPPWAYRFFTGVPAPMGAAVALFPLIVSFELQTDKLSRTIFLIPWLMISGGLMISRIPTFSFKGIHIPRPLIFPVLVGVGLAAAAFVSLPWLTMAFGIILYLFSLPFSYRLFRTLGKEDAIKDQENPVQVPPWEN